MRRLLQLMQSEEVAEAELRLASFSAREEYVQVIVDIMREEQEGKQWVM